MTTSTTADTVPARASVSPATSAPLPTVVAMGAKRVVYEIIGYFRTGDTVLFTFMFPVLMLSIFATAFGSMDPIRVSPDSEGVSFVQYYLPAMLAAGLLLSGVQNLAIDIATERSDGTLKRLGGTPLLPTSYFVGKLGQVLVTGLLQAALVLIVGVAAFGADLPSDPAAWGTFAWVFVLGILTSALLGIALSALPRSGKSASAVVIPIALVLQFISGVYLPFFQLPDWLQTVGKVFPLAWMAQGMRSVFLPDELAVLESGGTWDLGSVALWLGVWLVAGLVISRLTFRWNRRDA